MKVGDLVRYRSRSDRYALGLGIVLGFDENDDPLVHFPGIEDPKPGGILYYSINIEVVSEGG